MDSHRLGYFTAKEVSLTLSELQIISLAEAGDVLGLRAEVEHGGNVNCRGGMYNATCLMYAAGNGHIRTVQFLVEEAKAEVNLSDDMGETALSHAAHNDHLDIVRYLVEYARANVNQKNQEGSTALMDAVYENNYQVVRFLINTKATVNHRDEDGCTALMHASGENHLGIVKLLLDSHANANIQDNLGHTVLMCAANLANNVVVKHLLDHSNANVSIRDKYGNTALLHAAGNNHTEIVRILLEAKANVDAQNTNGDTALICASFKNNLETVQYLVESAKASTAIPGDERKTALEWARDKQHHLVIEFLEKSATGKAPKFFTFDSVDIHRTGMGSPNSSINNSKSPKSTTSNISKSPGSASSRRRKKSVQFGEIEVHEIVQDVQSIAKSPSLQRAILRQKTENARRKMLKKEALRSRSMRESELRRVAEIARKNTQNIESDLKQQTEAAEKLLKEMEEAQKVLEDEQKKRIEEKKKTNSPTLKDFRKSLHAINYFNLDSSDDDESEESNSQIGPSQSLHPAHPSPSPSASKSQSPFASRSSLPAGSRASRRPIDPPARVQPKSARSSQSKLERGDHGTKSEAKGENKSRGKEVRKPEGKAEMHNSNSQGKKESLGRSPRTKGEFKGTFSGSFRSGRSKERKWNQNQKTKREERQMKIHEDKAGLWEAEKRRRAFEAARERRMLRREKALNRETEASNLRMCSGSRRPILDIHTSSRPELKKKSNKKRLPKEIFPDGHREMERGRNHRGACGGKEGDCALM